MDIAAIERDVAGQPSKEWDSQAKEEDQADHHDEAADDDEQLADFRHDLMVRLKRSYGTGDARPARLED